MIGQASGWRSRIDAVNDEAQVARLSKFTWNGGLVGVGSRVIGGAAEDSPVAGQAEARSSGKPLAENRGS